MDVATGLPILMESHGHSAQLSGSNKLGKKKLSLEDLDNAIELDPQCADALWQRHLMYTLLNQHQLAVDDLNTFLQLNKRHVSALKSRGLLYSALGEMTLAIHSLNMALKYQPTDCDIYLYRAEIYEKMGESLMAMADYAMCKRIDPSNTTALLKHALHHFRECNWHSAVEDLDNLLQYNPYHSDAHFYRGRAHAHLGLWTAALLDLSAAIHLCPCSSQAYYYRGCILRKCHPQRALQDFSVSLLMDSSVNNVMSYLQRGQLYTEMESPQEAVSDLQHVVSLDPSISDACINLGLIYMLQLKNNYRALKMFSSAIHANPTNIKALMCRAEAYQRIHNLRHAHFDVNRILHMHPDMSQLYIWHGDILRRLGQLELAKFCIRQLAELGVSVVENPVQQALVHSFLKNYDKAIDVLQVAVFSNNAVEMLVLLGKIQMKAIRWIDAINSLQRALKLLKLPDKNTLATEVNFFIGICNLELNLNYDAHYSFSSAIKHNSKHALSFFWRGVAKFKVGDSKGIQDINKCLITDPNLFQAYVTRAAYYGQQDKFSKAVLNCNEAIRLQPSSVRAYLYRGVLKYKLQAYQLAALDLTRAIELDIVCRSAYFNRALCFQAINNTNQAIKDYSVVLLLADDYTETGTEQQLSLGALINRSILYLQLEDFTNALDDLLHVLKLLPLDKTVHHSLGICYNRLGCLEDAVCSHTNALNLDRLFIDALIGRGNAFLDMRHATGCLYAKHDYERALLLDPMCLMARINLAHILQDNGKFMQAWQQLTSVLVIKPRLISALANRAIISMQMNDTFSAHQDISRAINIEPTADLVTNRGVIKQLMNDNVAAIRDYQHALELDPNYSLAHFNMANMYFCNHQFKQALNNYDSAVCYNHQDESALLNRAITKVMLKDTKSAVEDLTAALAISPYSAHIYFNRANLFASVNLLTKADQDFTTALLLQPGDTLTLLNRAEIRNLLGQKADALDDHKQALDLQTRPIYYC